MNYANDPLWAYKSTMDPYARQAYDNQVASAQVAQQHHRTEFDVAATAAAAVLIGNWFHGRAARKARKAAIAYAREHEPRDYGTRGMEYRRAVEALEQDTERTINSLQREIADLEWRLPLAGTASSHRTLKARMAAFKAMVEDRRRAYDVAREALTMKYRDVVDFEKAMASFQ